MTGQDVKVKDPMWFESKRPMSLGLMLPIREWQMGGDTPRFEDMVRLAETARQVGFEVIWFADHFTMMQDGKMAGVWEAWMMMAGVAARVPDVQVGPMVSCTGFRNPALIAKMAETLDEISGGRFIAGLGAGWNELEYRQFGFPFDYRASRFEEAIQIIHPLMREGKVDFQGRFYEANEAVNRPRGPREGGVPLLIGSNGDRLLKTVARYADAWNSDWHSSVDDMKGLISKVDAACVAVGRDPDTLIKTGMARFEMSAGGAGDMDAVRGTTDDMADRLAEMRDLGLKSFVVGLEPRTVAEVEEFGEVIAKLDARQ